MENSGCNSSLLALDDGTIFTGRTCGINKTVVGAVVFNTSPTGYQEICTDPSYAGQIILFTSPHIGNVGINDEDYESSSVWAKGILVLEMSKTSSNWRSKKNFISFLEEHQIPWIEGIDTRKLTRHLRERGTRHGCMMVGSDAALAVKLAGEKKGGYQHSLQRSLEYCPISPKKKIAVFDFGVKGNILRILAQLGCQYKVFPSSSSHKEILAWKPGGVVISNGPGDPASLIKSIEETKKLIESETPIFGICLGCQLIALAMGGKTEEMKFGHHGSNHPVYDFEKNKVYVSSQNHLFVVADKNLPSCFTVTHRSLFDGSVQGIRMKGRRVFGFQGHPEGAPGPQDIVGLFHTFLDSVCH